MYLNSPQCRNCSLPLVCLCVGVGNFMVIAAAADYAFRAGPRALVELCSFYESEIAIHRETQVIIIIIKQLSNPYACRENFGSV